MKPPPAVYLGYIWSAESPCVCRGWRYVNGEEVSVIQVYNDRLFILKIAFWGKNKSIDVYAKQNGFSFKDSKNRKEIKHPDVERQADMSGFISWR